MPGRVLDIRVLNVLHTSAGSACSGTTSPLGRGNVEQDLEKRIKKELKWKVVCKELNCGRTTGFWVLALPLTDCVWSLFWEGPSAAYIFCLFILTCLPPKDIIRIRRGNDVMNLGIVKGFTDVRHHHHQHHYHHHPHHHHHLWFGLMVLTCLKRLPKEEAELGW